MIALLATLALAGCGGSDEFANEERPPAPINVSAAISDERISVSPQEFGAGPIVLIVSNQTRERREAIFETDEIGGEEPGLAPQSTGPIRPNGTATLKVDVREGTYALRTDRHESVRVDVGEPRPTSQHDLLQP
jgi:hypothetical protein